MACGLPMAHMFTFLSSPPVTITPEDLRPIFRQFTAEVCAANSCLSSLMMMLSLVLLLFAAKEGVGVSVG